MNGRRGGFLQRAGVAAAMIITGVTGSALLDDVFDPSTKADVFVMDIPGSVQVFPTIAMMSWYRLAML